MRVSKAVITAASPKQRTLPLQILIDRDGVAKSVLRILIEEVRHAGIEDICVVTTPGDEQAYGQAAGEHSARLHFVPQPEPLGYAHAVYCAREFTQGEPFLHMVGDHLYLSDAQNCAQQLVEVARAQSCSVSGVQRTRENLLPYFGAIGGQRLRGTHDLYKIDRVMEKPTPTEAEQALIVPGLRSGHYLCFFGMHVLSPAAMEILHRRISEAAHPSEVQFSQVLAQLAASEQYLAVEVQGRRFPIDVRYGLFLSQLALALDGKDREEVLAGVCDLLAQRELRRG